MKPNVWDAGRLWCSFLRRVYKVPREVGLYFPRLAMPASSAIAKRATRSGVVGWPLLTVPESDGMEAAVSSPLAAPFGHMGRATCGDPHHGAARA